VQITILSPANNSVNIKEIPGLKSIGIDLNWVIGKATQWQSLYLL
jgi:hypothetical protein